MLSCSLLYPAYPLREPPMTKRDRSRILVCWPLNRPPSGECVVPVGQDETLGSKAVSVKSGAARHRPRGFPPPAARGVSRR
jgi:hypothetical protein